MAIGVNEKIKTVIENLSTAVTYIRAVTVNEANYTLPKTLLTVPVGINANLEAISFDVSPSSSYTTFNFPCDVWFLKKNTSQDDTGPEIDTILDEMFDLANEFFDTINPKEGSGLPVIDAYTLEPVFNWSDEMLTGYRLQFDLPERRTIYNCG